MLHTKLKISFIVIGLMMVLPLSSAFAIPTLQFYLEGSTYDYGTESWFIETSSPLNLWVIGDVGHYGEIEDVSLVAAVYTSELSGGSISVTPTTTSVITDPSTPGTPSLTVDPNVTPNNGERPLLGDGSALPSHGIYVPTRDAFDDGVSFFQWDIGDFELTDSPIGDFIDAFPTEFPSDGQVNAYSIDISGFSYVHFDAFDHIRIGNGRNGKIKYVFAPFSHDAFTVPESKTWLLLGTCLLFVVVVGRKAKVLDKY
jgi:hypothetical protein